VAVAEADGGTRERILDVALELFVANGFDKTSLREIADELGFTKAALYYHFRSKDDILLALHLRFHALLDGALEELSGAPATPRAWARFTDQLVVEAFSHPALLLLHERNRAAFEHLHDKGHEGHHQELEDKLRALLADASVPLRERVRLICALGAVVGSIILVGDAFADVGADTIGGLVQEAVRDLLGAGWSKAAPHGRA
jgi:AcrR family transcriptional regulator